MSYSPYCLLFLRIVFSRISSREIIHLIHSQELQQCCLLSKMNFSFFGISDRRLDKSGRIYYGDETRLHSTEHQHGLLIQTSHTDGGCIEFSSPDQRRLYLARMNEVKERIDVVANQRRDRLISEEQFKTVLREQWIPLVDHFISQWSETLVPIDIRQAVDDVRKNVDLPKIAWPPLRRIRKATNGNYYLDSQS